jgi:excinuclease ABC subunit C
MRSTGERPFSVRTASDSELEAMRAHVRANAADRPGVYRMLSADGEIVYVGKSKQVRSRLLSYFRCEYPEEKGARILREARSIDWEYCPSEFAALLTELRLIKRLRPRYNVMMKADARHYAFIKISSPPAPKLVVARTASGTDHTETYYGPFHGARQLEEATRELSDALGLRDCAKDVPMRFTDQGELFGAPQRTPGCIRFEIGKCLGPCIGGTSIAQYDERVRLARAFFDGTDDGPLGSISEAMRDASERLQFERAAALRDKLKRLEGLRDQFGRLRFAVETLSFVYTVRGWDGSRHVYAIRRGCIRAERSAPRTAGERREWRDLVRGVFAPKQKATLSVPAHEIDELQLLSSWFRRFPVELKRTSQWPASCTA